MFFQQVTWYIEIDLPHPQVALALILFPQVAKSCPLPLQVHSRRWPGG